MTGAVVTGAVVTGAVVTGAVVTEAVVTEAVVTEAVVTEAVVTEAGALPPVFGPSRGLIPLGPARAARGRWRLRSVPVRPV